MTAAPSLTTERLILRPPTGQDWPALAAFFAAPRSRFYGGPKDTGAAWRTLAAFAGQWPLLGYGFFAVIARGSGSTIGLAGPFHPADFPEPEMSWLLTDEAHEGQGLAREACAAVLRHLFATRPWPSVVSFIDPDNHASRALALRLGATADPATPAPAALPGCATFRHARATWTQGAATEHSGAAQ